jgi:ferrous iron transport protein B
MNQVRRQLTLVGNPNIGKSSLFNQLTGLQQKIGNFAGVTIEKKTGRFESDHISYEITDLPGSYSLVPKSPDETVVFNEIIRGLETDQTFVVVVDASNLSRNLLFFSQLADLKKPCLVALTMMDVAEKRGISLDINALEKELGCPVVPVNGRTGEGVIQLKAKLPDASVPLFRIFKPELAAGFSSRSTEQADQYINWLNWVSGGANQEKTTGSFSTTDTDPKLALAKETVFRYQMIKKVTEKVEKNSGGKEDSGFKFDRIALHPIFGYVLMLVVLLIVFEGIFELASYPMEWIENVVGSIGSFLEQILPEGVLKRFLLEGILAGIQGIVIFIPQIAILFGLIGLLEQSGYMARVMILLDRLMGKIGLSGKAIVPLISGVACAVPAILSTRSMTSRRERLIAIFVTPLMSCSARLPVFTLLIALLIPARVFWGPVPLQGLVLFSLYLIGLLGAVITAFILHHFLPGKQTGSFILEIPPYQLPNWKHLGISVYQKSMSFVLEAGKIILAISVILWYLAGFGPGDSIEKAAANARVEAASLKLTDSNKDHLVASRQLEASYAGIAGRWIEPAIQPMGFDWKIGVALISSFAAREVFVGTMSILYASGSDGEPGLLRSKMEAARNPSTGLPVFTPAVITSLLVFYIFAMQCMSTLAVSYRETGSWKWPFLQLIYMTGLSFGLSTWVFHLLS